MPSTSSAKFTEDDIIRKDARGRVLRDKVGLSKTLIFNEFSLENSIQLINSIIARLGMDE